MQFESELHPFISTAVVHENEDSVDTTVDSLRHRTPQDQDQRLFGIPGIDTQGPAGSRVPDLDGRPRHPPKFGDEEETECGYPEDPEAPPGAVGPHAAIEVDMTEADFVTDAGDAAAEAVLVARQQGATSGSAMLDALEAAEAAYEQQQQQQAQQQQQTQQQFGFGQAQRALELRAASTSSSGGWGGGADAGAPPPDTPRKAAICEATRERIIQKIFESLQANPRYCSEPSLHVMSCAKEVEDALYASSHSKQVYLSKVSNAVRLARTVVDGSDIPRIASGEPREVAEGHTAGEATPYISGLQGFVVKPEIVP